MRTVNIRLLLLVVTACFSFTQVQAKEYLFSSESVTEGHPDKICDQISDAILDAILAQDPEGRVACETVAAKDTIFITGEITTTANIDIEAIARATLREIGYTKREYGIDADTCRVEVLINHQSPEIAQGVDEEQDHEQGAGDQGLMFGYACNDTRMLMPLPIMLAHHLTKRLAEMRKTKELAWLRPDGKAQVTVRYVRGKPTEITTVIIGAQHDPEVDTQLMHEQIKERVIKPICGKFLTETTKYHINATGMFVTGGPEADAGLTGRKIIVDTYGGMSRHGGGAFSGKDPSKVDRSASYMARHIAKNIVAAKLANRCEVQIAYCIGVAEPVSVYVDTFRTGRVSDEELTKAVKAIFPLKPAQIISYLDLKKPVYRKSAAYGHFGQNGFTWEKTNKARDLQDYFKK